MVTNSSSTETVRSCLTCGKVVRGRTDKKFCDDYCRNAYNNRQNAITNNYMRNVNNALRRNRRILESIIGDAQTRRYQRQRLVDRGFEFAFFTHQSPNRKGQVFRFCYEFGYLILDEDWILIVREEM